MKGSLVKSKNITLDINMGKLEHNKTYEYLGTNKKNDMNHAINKEKVRKRFYCRIRAILKIELNAKIKL